MDAKYRHVVTLYIFMVAPCVLAQDARNEERASLTHQAGSIVLDVASGRPMATVAQALMNEYGYAISYEDPRYQYRDDLHDVSGEVRRDGRSGLQDPRYAIGVPQTRRATITVPDPKSQGDISAALEKVAGAFKEGGGHFEVERSKAIVHIFPREVRDENGNWTNNSSVMDSSISMPKLRGTDDQLIAAICEAVSVAAGVRVEPGIGVGGGIFIPGREPQYEISADNERARDVLVKALTLFGHGQMRQTWFLFYGNNSTDDWFAMNLIPVPVKANTTQQKAPTSSVPEPIGGAEGLNMKPRPNR